MSRKPTPRDAPADEEELEEGLEETFPGSDAPAATQPVHHNPKKKKPE